MNVTPAAIDSPICWIPDISVPTIKMTKPTSVVEIV
jgi:hypothetical protein